VNGKYALNASEADAVRKIFADYIGGKSLRIIATEMEIPYNVGKNKWNINMVCRVLENRKYIGENSYPQIITVKDFEQAARIKAERNTYRKPALQNKPWRQDEINRLLDSENPDKIKVEALIIKCAQLKYTTICEVKT